MRNNKGFSVIEFVMIIALIGFTIGAFSTQLETISNYFRYNKQDKVFFEVSNAFREYIITSMSENNDDYDKSFEQEMNKYLSEETKIVKKDSVYESKYLDMWGNNIYLKPVKLHERSFVLITKSKGPDNTMGSSDDITIFTQYIRGKILTASIGTQLNSGRIINNGSLDRAVNIFELEFSEDVVESSNTVISQDFEVTE